MPSEGVELSPGPSILSDDEVIRLASLFVKCGVTKIRLTGGEPTIRRGIVELVGVYACGFVHPLCCVLIQLIPGRLGELRNHGLKAIAMTSNGVALHRKLPALIDNGLTHLNLRYVVWFKSDQSSGLKVASLDTLDPFKFEIMTRRPGHEAVIRSLDIALKSPRLQSVKLNVVIIRDLNDMEILDFVRMTEDSPLSIRFIEFMPFTGKLFLNLKDENFLILFNFIRQQMG